MPGNFAETSWPTLTPVSAPAKDLLATLFDLVDLADPNAGEALAEKVFTDDAVFVAPAGTFTGKSGQCPSFQVERELEKRTKKAKSKKQKK